MSGALLLALACSGPDGGRRPDDTSVPEEGAPPSPYIVDEATDPVPTATLTEVEQALQDALDQVLDVSAAPVQTAYDAAMASRTASCPYEYVTPDGTYWYDSCSTPSGSEFDGYVFALGEQGLYDPYSGLLYDYWYAFGGATVTDDGGHRLEVGGLASTSYLYGDYGGIFVEVWSNAVQGTFGWDGPEAAGTWLEGQVDPDVVWVVTGALTQSTIVLDGGYGGFREGWAVAFDENVAGEPLLGVPCREEVSGTVGVRAPDGTWYDVVFDGLPDTSQPMDDALCDGCGVAWFRGELVGTVCVDLAGLFDRAAQPW